MDVETAAPPVVEVPVVAPPAPEESTSLADHEAQFAPGAAKREQPPADDAREESGAPDKDPTTGRFTKRAASQRAGAKDVDEIAELTKRLRQAEADAGITAPERKQGESDRAYSIRRQAEVMEALRDARRAPKPSPNSAPQPRHEVAQPQPQAQRPAPPAFAEPEPEMEAFANEANPLAAYTKAVAAWEWRRQMHDAQQQVMAARSQQSQAQALEQSKAHAAKVQANIDEFAKTHPDYWAKMDAVDDMKLPDILLETISTDDNPAKLAYALATHQDELIDLIGFSIGLDYSPESVALLRRRLARNVRDIDAKTGASPLAPAPVTVAPRPPTPVRTGPLKTGDEPPDDSDSSISNHEKTWGPNRRR